MTLFRIHSANRFLQTGPACPGVLHKKNIIVSRPSGVCKTTIKKPNVSQLACEEKICNALGISRYTVDIMVPDDLQLKRWMYIGQVNLTIVNLISIKFSLIQVLLKRTVYLES